MMDGESDSEQPDGAQYHLPTRSSPTMKGQGHKMSQSSLTPGPSSEPPTPAPVIVIDDQTHRLTASMRSRKDAVAKHSTEDNVEFENSCVYLAENSIEAKKISNNFMFGMKKWKSHVTSRPLVSRSEIVQNLYSDMSEVKDVKAKQGVIEWPFNVVYSLLFGWWLALLYVLVGVLMCFTIIGIPHGWSMPQSSKTSSKLQVLNSRPAGRIKPVEQLQLARDGELPKQPYVAISCKEDAQKKITDLNLLKTGDALR
ncbi:uncharacterized protein LOC101855008 [Aplysia californica]|uniref:Uncharacterized protein LOC101855008 n=1 Tax=Aplysia californica TaxID=6500 RepID=A0ABM0ZWK9_APLCA|nr:uncharacterized protein LOC101855008 [Aplysia californica]